jgi:fused signal recognition particle receptor
MSFPPIDPSPTAPDPGPVPPLFPRPIDDEPKEGEEIQAPDKTNPTENPQPGPSMPPDPAPFPDHLPNP